jgi:hypothetical protein
MDFITCQKLAMRAKCQHGRKSTSRCRDCLGYPVNEGKCSRCKKNYDGEVIDGKLLKTCVACRYQSDCPHGERLKHKCNKCRNKVCEHDKQLYRCIICSPQIACQNCKLELMSRTNTYQPYCFKCYCVLNPDIEIPFRYKVKENHLKEALEEMDLGVSFVNDQIVGGCSKRRPDFFLCDENAHRGYDTTCEIAKLNETFTDLADRQIVLIRFNPDKFEEKSCYDKNGKLIKCEWNERMNVLKEVLSKYLEDYKSGILPEELVTIEYLFFDAFN